MNITHAFIERLAAMDQFDLGIFLQKHKAEIDFNLLITKAKEKLKIIAELPDKFDMADSEKRFLEKQTGKINDLIEDSVIYAAAQLHPNAVEGPELYEINTTPLKTFS